MVGARGSVTLQVGYAQKAITPSLERPVYLAGFGQNRRAESVHDDLYVRALVLEHGHVSLVWAALDLIGLGRQHCQEIERRVNRQAPGTRVLLACTHTHHGPDTIGLWGPDQTTSGVDRAYLARLKDDVVATVTAALAQLQTAHLRAASVQVAGLVRNARDPEILDEELTCLQFCRPETGAALATWLIYPCHPEVLWDENPHITSDYIGALRQAVEAETAAPCLAMVGAIGGMMTPNVEAHSFVESEQMGESLAQAALGTLSAARALPVEQLEHSCHEYNVPMANPLFRMAITAGLLPNLLNDDGSITAEANLVKIGPTWLFGVPGELLPKLGLACKEEMRLVGADVAAVVGLTNDELGYILPQEAYAYPDDPFDPGEHYEETMSIGPEAGPRLMAALRTIIDQQ